MTNATEPIEAIDFPAPVPNMPYLPEISLVNLWEIRRHAQDAVREARDYMTALEAELTRRF